MIWHLFLWNCCTKLFARQLKRCFYIHTLVTHHRLIITAQSICGIFLLPFAAFSRKLWQTFAFNILTSYDVTIPGKDSQITWIVATHLPNMHTDFKIYSCTGTVFFNANRKFNTKFGLSWYKWRHVLLKSSLHVYTLPLLIFL